MQDQNEILLCSARSLEGCAGGWQCPAADLAREFPKYDLMSISDGEEFSESQNNRFNFMVFPTGYTLRGKNFDQRQADDVAQQLFSDSCQADDSLRLAPPPPRPGILQLRPNGGAAIRAPSVPRGDMTPEQHRAAQTAANKATIAAGLALPPVPAVATAAAAAAQPTPTSAGGPSSSAAARPAIAFSGGVRARSSGVAGRGPAESKGKF